MSLEVIEMMIKESLRDGEISASERETLVKQGELFDISKETVVSMIDAEVEKLNIKVKEEQKKKQEQDIRIELENNKREIKEITSALDDLLDEYNESDISGKKAALSKSRILTLKLKKKGETELALQYEKQIKNPEKEQYVFIGAILLFLLVMFALAKFGVFGEGIF
jgi:hypothetical protein